MLRAARFAATLEMDLDPATEKAIEPTLATFRKVSQERVRDEWVKAMKAAPPSRAFEVMRQTGILGVLLCPELLRGLRGMDQPTSGNAFDVWKHGMECLDACVGDPILRISALLHDVGKARARARGRTRRTTGPSMTTTSSAPRSSSRSPRASASRTTTRRRGSSRSCAITCSTILERVDRRGRAPVDEARRHGSDRGPLRAE